MASGRLLLNIVSATPRCSAHDERYAMADEYPTVFRRILGGETVTFKGRYVGTVGAKLALPSGETIVPPAL